MSVKQLDDRVLVISRWATLGVMIVCVTMAWMLMVFSWLHGESPNPTSCAALAGLFAIGCTTAVSLATKPLPAAHVAALFRRVAATK